jgi:hypothetical protein
MGEGFKVNDLNRSAIDAKEGFKVDIQKVLHLAIL